MQNPPRRRFLRRLLFPYSGDEALSLKQSLRVLLAWMIYLPLIMVLCTLILSTIFAYSWQNMALFALFTFLSGFFIFGGLGVLVVITNNSSARIRQARKATRASNMSGER